LRVLVVIKGLGIGGAERLLLSAARYRSKGNRYLIANIDGRLENLRPQLIAAGYTVETFDMCSVKAPVSLLRLLRYVCDQRVSVIHAHLPVAGVISRLIGRLVGVPGIYTEHNVVSSYHTITGALNRWTYSLSNKNIAVSAAVRDSVLEHYRVDGEDGPLLIPNGIGLDEIDDHLKLAPNVRVELNIPDDHYVCGTVARFHEVKRLDLLVRAFTRMKKLVPRSTLVLVGDGPTRPAIARLVRDLGVEEDVRMPGMQSQPLGYMAALDTFVLCSDWEGLPVALLEAMAAGRPVIATRVGGVPELLEHGVSGLLINPGDCEQLSEAIQTMAQAPALAATYGSNARRRVATRFDLKAVVSETEALYSNCGRTPSPDQTTWL